MSKKVALAAVDQLFEGVVPGQRATVGFIGGEPFLNREVLYATVEHASKQARSSGSRVGFSVTTNGTLLTKADLDLLRDHSFAVSVSLDGSGRSTIGIVGRATEPEFERPCGLSLAAAESRERSRHRPRHDHAPGLASVGTC